MTARQLEVLDYGLEKNMDIRSWWFHKLKFHYEFRNLKQ